VVIDLGDNVGVRSRLIELGGIRMLDLQPTLAESGSYLVQKRVSDIAFSVFLLFTLPISLLIALAIKLTSRGAIFFVQERVGLNGRVFKVLKFRTMRLGSREESDTRWISARRSPPDESRCAPAANEYRRSTAVSKRPDGAT
jgi:lipopolysaccharide/colanic/teichoic acid biosynthesis glycosyltransferase